MKKKQSASTIITMPPKGGRKPPVADERSRAQLNSIANDIGSSAERARRRLAAVEAALKEDLKGVAEFEALAASLATQRADLEARAARNRRWADEFDRGAGAGSGEAGAFQSQYSRLVQEMKGIYEGAKEFHATGIGLLIKEFGYHVMYKKWDSTFSAVPFKPK